MIRNPILTRFELFSRLWQPEQRNLRSAFLRPGKLPQFVQDCPSAMRLLDLLGPISWDQFPERDLRRSWGQTTIPHVAFSAACLIKLNESLVSMGDLHRYLIEHPALVWLLGFPLVSSVKHACGFDPVTSLPTQRHLTQMLRDIPNDALQFILDQTVALLLAELSALGLSVGDCISLDTKHILAWVKENNPKTYVSERFNKQKQPMGDPDCKLGCKRKHNRKVITSQPPKTPAKDFVPANTVAVGQYCWGYGSGITVTIVEHERGKYVCPFFSKGVKNKFIKQCCPVHHTRARHGGCTASMPLSVGARLRYSLDRQCQAYKEIYNQRTATERINSQAVNLGIERPHFRNGNAIANLNTLTYALINLRLLQRVRLRLKLDR